MTHSNPVGSFSNAWRASPFHACESTYDPSTRPPVLPGYESSFCTCGAKFLMSHSLAAFSLVVLVVFQSTPAFHSAMPITSSGSSNTRHATRDLWQSSGGREVLPRGSASW